MKEFIGTTGNRRESTKARGHGKAAALFAAAAFTAVLLGIMIGSVRIPAGEIAAVFLNRVSGVALPAGVKEIEASIIWNIRMPQVLSAFCAGAALSAAGCVMQSLMRNPLASSYTLGVSSGASLCAAAVIVTGVSFFGRLTLPAAGFAGGLLTVTAATLLALHFDRTLENQTVILIGMVLSLFVNGLLTMVVALSADHLARLVFWQMGSFSGQTWQNVRILAAVFLICLPVLFAESGTLDLMTFGDEQALSAGVEVRRKKILLIFVSALLAGTTVSLVGVIGFVDLIAPHIARRFFGSAHRRVIPASACAGGALMVLADLAGRTVIAPKQLPVGAVTALIGAPFFTWIFFRRRKGDHHAGT